MKYLHTVYCPSKFLIKEKRDEGEKKLKVLTHEPLIREVSWEWCRWSNCCCLDLVETKYACIGISLLTNNNTGVSGS